MSKLEYRMDFIANTLRSLKSLLLGLITFTVIFATTPYLAGWSKNEALVLYSVFVVIDELYYALFFSNLTSFPKMIEKGELDGLLLKPVSIQFLVSLRYLLVFAVPNIIIGFFMIFYFMNKLSIPFSLFSGIVTFLLILNGVVVLYSIMLAMVTLCFWIIRLQAFWAFYDTITEGARYPVDIFKGPVRFFFLFIIPIGVIFTFPAQFLVKGLSLQMILFSFFVGFISFFLSHKFFYLGVRHYNSASS